MTVSKTVAGPGVSRLACCALRFECSVAVCCSVLQCVAMCCSVLQCVAVLCPTFGDDHYLQLINFAVLTAVVSPSSRSWCKCMCKDSE